MGHTSQLVRARQAWARFAATQGQSATPSAAVEGLERGCWFPLRAASPQPFDLLSGQVC
jgi:hypothetical protein